VNRAVRWFVEYGLEHRDLSGIAAISVDETAVWKGHKYLTVVYQIHQGNRRLFWAGRDRTKATIRKFFEWTFAFSRPLRLEVLVDGAATYAALARASMRTATFLGMSDRGALAEKMVHHSMRRSEARASGKEGVFFDWYQGREGQETLVPCVVRYQCQTAE
jgi:hypothetical protein